MVVGRGALVAFSPAGCGGLYPVSKVGILAPSPLHCHISLYMESFLQSKQNKALSLPLFAYICTLSVLNYCRVGTSGKVETKTDSCSSSTSTIYSAGLTHLDNAVCCHLQLSHLNLEVDKALCYTSRIGTHALVALWSIGCQTHRTRIRLRRRVRQV